MSLHYHYYHHRHLWFDEANIVSQFIVDCRGAYQSGAVGFRDDLKIYQRSGDVYRGG